MPKRGRTPSTMGSRKRARVTPSKSNYKRRRWMSRKRRNGTKTKILRTIPDRMLVKLTYIDTFRNANIALDGSGRPSVQRVKTYKSSLYDPDFAVGGHQPLWYDQYQVLYQKYRVHGIKYDIIVNNNGQNETFYLMVRPYSSALIEVNYETLMERGNCHWRQGGSVNSGSDRVRMKGYMNVAKTLGISKRQVSLDDKFESNWGTDPATMAYLNLYVANWLGSGTTLTYTVKLTYYCSFHDRVTPNGS